ncbi:MAG: beta-lactamase family protein, partial [Flavobacteriales bacterium]|nr:beta-lactamase family protein [Flavobacteriales bacterium]
MPHRLLLILATLSALLICRQGSAQYENLNEYLDRMTELKKFTGTVMIATDDKTLFEKATGPATADGVLMNATNSVYRIGSITKSFTSVLILKSVEAGKMSLDDKLSTWHPEVTNADKVTVRQLLSHTSGNASYTDLPDMAEWKYDDNSVADIIIRFRGLKSEFEPGTRFKYSNSNYFLLGSILEKIYEKPYAEITAAMITEPLGMRQTGVDSEANGVELSTGLSPNIDGWKQVPPVHPTVPYAEGALYSSVSDLHTFSAALFGNRIFAKKATLSDMQTPVIGTYALGLFESEVAGEKALAHNGGIDGYSSTWLYFPERGLHIISLSNSMLSD